MLQNTPQNKPKTLLKPLSINPSLNANLDIKILRLANKSAIDLEKYLKPIIHLNRLVKRKLIENHFQQSLSFGFKMKFIYQ